MLLATYQPIAPDEAKRDPRCECFRDRMDGEYPVFCIPARTPDEFGFRSLIEPASKPERLYIVDVDEYERFDTVTWHAIVNRRRDGAFRARFESMFEDVDERFSEYAVKPACLDRPLLALDIRSFMVGGGTRYEGPDSGLGAYEDAREMYLRLKRDAVEGSYRLRGELAGALLDDRVDKEATAFQKMFAIYLGSIAWRCASGSIVTAFDMIPFAPDACDSWAMELWNRFGELRWALFDSALGGTHDEFLTMCEAFEGVAAATRAVSLKRLNRNGPCPCRSGKKFKNCHGKKMVELFPF